MNMQKKLIHHNPTSLEAPVTVAVDNPHKFEGNRHRESVLIGAYAVNQLAEAQAEARTDGISGLLNRKGFSEGLAELIESSTEAGAPRIAILFVDLDNFKQVNDEHEDKYAAGDKVIRSMGLILGDFPLREDEVVGRIGGDEFGIAIRTMNDKNDDRDISKDDKDIIDGFTNRLKREVGKLAQEIGIPTLGVSVGAEMYRKGEYPDEFITRVSTAMHEDKKNKKFSYR